MKRGSWNHSVSPPNTTTSPPEIHSIGEMVPSFTRDTIIAAIVATMNAAVAQITRAITSAPTRSIPSRNPDRLPTSRIIGAAGARKLTRKKTISGA